MKKFAGLLLTLTLLATMLCAFALPAAAETPYAGLNGSGTKTDPYQIQNSTDWDTFSSAVSADPDNGKGLYFKLTNDIGSEENEIRTNVGKFYGVLDGAGKTVWYDNNKSLFNTNYGEILNIITRGNVELRWSVGGVICNENRGVIDHCVNNKPLEFGFCVGGICGNNHGLIVNCINYAPISRTLQNAGGICCKNYGRILNCINTAPISGSGICGSNDNTAAARIEVCFNCGQPSSGYSITQFDSHMLYVSLFDCWTLPSINGRSVRICNDDENDNAANGPHGTMESCIDGMNHDTSFHDDVPGHKLCTWKLGNDGLPAFAGDSTASVFSEGNWWIIAVGAALILGGVSSLVIVKKKKKPAIADGKE